MSSSSRVTKPWYVEQPSLTLCVVCHKESSDCGGSESGFFSCPKCHGFAYCSEQCQSIHWEEDGHKETCKAHVYLHKDYQYLMTKLKCVGVGGSLEFSDMLKIVGHYAEGQKLRVVGNENFQKKQWTEALDIYCKCVPYFQDTMERYEGTDVYNVLRFLMGGHLSRIYSNIIVCQLEQTRDKWLSLDPSAREEYHLDKTPVHDSKMIIAQVRTLGGLKQAQAFFAKEYEEAWKVAGECTEVGISWWKAHYRHAQVELLRAEPEKAMRAIEKAYHYAKNESDLFYDKDKEYESARSTIQMLEIHVKNVLLAFNVEYSERDKIKDGAISSIQHLLSDQLTQINDDHPRIPRSQLGPEILAVRLFAAITGARPNLTLREFLRRQHEQDRDRAEACEFLNLILSSMSQAPLFLYPPDGSDERCPPLTVSLIAFYLRTAMSPKQLAKMDVEARMRRATEWLSDERAYCIATYNFREFESNHSPLRGHAKGFYSSGAGNCMPCCFRLLRSGDVKDWGEGLQSAAHQGSIEALCFFLNRLLSGIDGVTVLEAILAEDKMGCNAVMHAANENFTGFSGLTMRLLAHAASFSAGEEASEVRMRNVRRVLNTADRSGYTPSLAAITMRNEHALAALVSMRAKLYEKESKKKKKKDNEKKNKLPVSIQMQVSAVLADKNMTPRFRNLVRSIESSTNDHASCSFCGRPPASKETRLAACSRCQRARYCNAECQKADYKRHKYICTAKVSKDVAWYSANIHVAQG